MGSEFGAKLKQEMLLRLLDKDTKMYPDDEETREKIYNRYKKYVIEREDAEWIGLTLREAMLKQWNLEKEQGLHDSKPLLEIFTEELKQKLQVASAQKSLPPQEDAEDSTKTAEPSPIFQPKRS